MVFIFYFFMIFFCTFETSLKSGFDNYFTFLVSFVVLCGFSPEQVDITSTHSQPAGGETANAWNRKQRQAKVTRQEGAAYNLREEVSKRGRGRGGLQWGGATQVRVSPVTHL